MIPERIVHTSTEPISESLQLSLLVLLLLRSAASGDFGCFLRLFGSRLVHLSTLSPVSKSAFHSVLPVVGLVTISHLQRAMSNHCCYWQLLLLFSKTADAGGAGELPLWALKAMSLALGSSAYWATLSLARSNRMWPSVVLLTGVSTCGNDTVRNGRRSACGQLLRWPHFWTSVCVTKPLGITPAQWCSSHRWGVGQWWWQWHCRVWLPHGCQDPNYLAICFQCIWCQVDAAAQQTAIPSFSWWQPSDRPGF